VSDIIFESTDPEGRKIVLSKNTWGHIKKGHPEVNKNIALIKSTIQKPDLITEISSRTSLAYTSISSISFYYNVFAKMDDKYEKGRVTTAFVQADLPKGSVIWSKKT